MRHTLVFSTLLLSACTAGGDSGTSRIAERFLAADIDGDGLLSRGEAPARLDFEAADADGNGLLSRLEVEMYTQTLRN